MIDKKYTYSDFDTKYFKEHNLEIKNFDINKDGNLDNDEVNTLLSIFDVKSVGYLLTQEKLKEEVDNIEEDSRNCKIINICTSAFTGTFLAGLPVTILTKIKKVPFKASVGIMLLGLAGGVITGITLAKKKINEDENYFSDLKKAHDVRRNIETCS